MTGGSSGYALRRRSVTETPLEPAADAVKRGVASNLLTGRERSGGDYLNQGRPSPRPSPKEINNISDN